MAIFPMSVSMVDGYGRPINKRYDLSAADYATALTNAAAFITDLEAISEAAVLWYTVATRVTVSDTATEGGNRDEGLTISVRTADMEKAVIKVPAPINAIFQADGTLDLTNSVFQDFIANYTGGLVLVDDGETVVGYLSGHLDE